MNCIKKDDYKISDLEVFELNKEIQNANPYKRTIRQQYEYYNTKIKTYPNGAKLVVTAPYRLKEKTTSAANASINTDKKNNEYCYNNNLNFDAYRGNEFDIPNVSTNSNYAQKNKKDSSKRSKDMIMDIAKSNTFNLFGTFTTCPTQMKDRWDFAEFSDEIGKFLKSFKRRHKTAVYIVIPEQHENGAWHAHLLLNADISNELVDSGLVDKAGRVIYNWPQYKIGFTTFTYITDSARASSYVAKYMTKVNAVPKGKKRYWASTNVIKPIVNYDNKTQEQIDELNENADYSTEVTRSIRNYAAGTIDQVVYKYMIFNCSQIVHI